jgi:hypothetical protein
MSDTRKACDKCGCWASHCECAAISELTKENARLRAALTQIANADTWFTQQNNEAVSPWVIEVAKQALAGTTEVK